MSGRDGGVAATLSVHVYDTAPMAVRTYEPTDTHPAFVLVSIGGGGTAAELYFEDEASLNRLLKAAGEARAKLVGAITRAKRAEQVQPELPVAS